MPNGILGEIISLVNPSVVFNLWLSDLPSSPLLHFSFFLMHFFCKKQPPPLKLNTIQPPTTNPATITLSLSASVFLFKFDWGFSILNKQIYIFFYSNTIYKCYFFLHIFVVYIFCLGVYLFYSFFSYNFIICIYDLYMLWFVLYFVKLYLFVNWWNLSQIFYFGVLWWNK